MTKVKVYAVLHHGGNLYIPVKSVFDPHSYFDRDNRRKDLKHAYCSQLPNCFGGTVEGADGSSTQADDLRTLLAELDEESQGSITLTNPQIEMLIPARNIEGSVYKVYVMTADELTIARPFEMPTCLAKDKKTLIPFCDEAYIMQLNPYDDAEALRIAQNGTAALHSYLSRFENKCVFHISERTFERGIMEHDAQGIIQICSCLRVTPDEVAPQGHLAAFDNSMYRTAYDVFLHGRTI